MLRKELILIASRTFAMLMAVWTLTDVTYLPERIFAYSHHLALRSVLVTEDYLTSYYLLILAFTVVRIAGLAIAAGWFWRCGPRVESLLLPSDSKVST